MWPNPAPRGTGPNRSGSFFFLGIYQVDRVALITSLSAGMGLVTMITSLHLRPVGPRVKGIVPDIAMAIDT